MTDQWHTLLVDQYDQEEFERRYLAWTHGKALIEEAFPDLSENQRQFIKTGITSAEWKQYMGNDHE